jgi:hypothetical protein
MYDNVEATLYLDNKVVQGGFAVNIGQIVGA